MKERIAIVVLYNPNVEKLKKLNEKIYKNNFYTIFVDNSNEKTNTSFLKDGEIIFNNCNKGIASAQNIGLKRARELNFKKVVFFDQDTEINDNLLKNLEKKLNSKMIIAPTIVNKKTKEEYFPQKINKFGIAKNVTAQEEFVDIVISSGMFTDREVIEKVGEFDESLFIDFVDIEWCLRARKKGIIIKVDKESVIEHMIGEDSIELNSKINLVRHTSFRTYYKVRNSFLIFRKNLGIKFCMHQCLVALVHNFLLIFFVEKKVEYLKNYLLGVRDGLLNKSGSKK